MDTNYFKKKFQDAGIAKRLMQTLPQDNAIICVLASHLVIERMLEIWIEAFTASPDLLNKVQLSFSQKMKMCKNCQLPDEIITAVQKINKIRNDLSHLLEKHDIEDSEAEGLLQLVKKINLNPPIEDIYEFSMSTLNGMIKIKDASANQRVLFSGMVIMTAMLQEIDRH